MMRYLLPWLAGCHAVFGIEPGEGSPPGDSPTGNGCVAPAWIDTFDSLDQWRLDEDLRTMAAATDGTLAITLADATEDDYASALSHRVFNVTAAWVEVELVSAIEDDGSDTYFDVELESGWYGFSVRGDTVRIGSSSETHSRTYSAPAHRFLGISHDALANEMVYWVRSDTGMWTQADRTPVLSALPLELAQIRLGAGNNSSSTITGTARFDNLRLCTGPAA